MCIHTDVEKPKAKPRIVLKATTLWEKEVAKRIRRGIKLLDSVTPNWFAPINPETLVVSNRSSCVFAQASHDFKKGITQVAEKALAEGKPVRVLDNPSQRKYGWLPNSDKQTVLDVFFYGFDVTWEDAFTFGFALDSWDRKSKRGSRKDAFKTIDRMWKDVVVQKKRHATIPRQRSLYPLASNASFKQVKDWVRP